MKLEQRLREVLRRSPEVQLALLFGSRARGQSSPSSDIDLAVLGRDVDPARLSREVSEATGAEVDIVDVERAGYPLLKSIVCEGRVVYEAEPGAEGRWRARAVATLETDRPWFERMRASWLQRLALGAR